MNLDGIKGIALDVDGVLTDGGFWWGPDGGEWKRFSFADVMGISRASKAGIVFALISGEDSPLVDRFAYKMNITDVYKGSKDKQAALRAFAHARGLTLAEVCFMGDDVNDVEAMQTAGLAACPSDAQVAALCVASWVSRHQGGHGAVRELVEAVLAARQSR